jgi:hypothetical protein
MRAWRRHDMPKSCIDIDDEEAEAHEDPQNNLNKKCIARFISSPSNNWKITFLTFNVGGR